MIPERPFALTLQSPEQSARSHFTLVNRPLVMEYENNRNFTGPHYVLKVRETFQ